jgi:hypothetical protein
VCSYDLNPFKKKTFFSIIDRNTKSKLATNKYKAIIFESEGKHLRLFFAQKTEKSLKSDLYARIVLFALELLRLFRV